MLMIKMAESKSNNNENASPSPGRRQCFWQTPERETETCFCGGPK